MASKVAVSKIDLSWASPDVNIWIELPENDASGQAYKKGTIINVIDEETASVKYEGSNNAITLKGDKIFPLNNYAEYPEGYDDMVDIENLSEAELLYNVQLRFSQRQIYTYVGPTLIVLNPFMRIEKLLSTEVLYKFQDAVLENKLEPKDHMPHVYAIAGATMQKMFENKKNQAVVISGESGAGKTENTKHAMKFLTSLGSKSDDGAKNSGVEDRILACNPILEAFGNAKTVRNDNSSRFGKYVSLLVEKDSRKIIGATITNYLLEKSRVCNQTSEERNYHIFYALLRGATPELLQELCLVNDCDAYNYLRNSYQAEVKTVPDGPLFQEVSESFATMAFTDVEQKSIWSLTASSLLLGNVEFDDSALNDTTPCSIKQEDKLKNVAKLLGIDSANFIKSLTFKLRTIGGNTIESTINKEECLIYRDGLAKEIFNRLFNWLVKRLNFNVMPPSFAKPGANIQKLMDQYYHIGLLDIFGFEIFKINSLEQFCINFANERLQQLYIYYVFKAEEKEFINEGLKDYLSQLDFKDNQALLDMLDGNKPPGIFQLLDESSSVNTTDSALGTKIIQTFKKPEYPLTTAKLAKDTFIVKHSAKDVEYDVNGFRAKNKDELSKFIEDNMTNSAIKAVSKIWRNLTLDEPEPLDSKKAINPKDKFLGYKFRMQMKDLIDELNSCECHFVRCIKPNEKKEAALFEPAMVLQQIQYMGVLDTIKVRKQSYPVRRLYKSYYERYQELDPINSKLKLEEHVAKGADFKEMTKNICQRKVPHLGPNQILFGNTRVFLRIEAVKELEKMRSDQIKKKHRTAAKFQAVWKRHKQYKKYTALKKGVSEVQKLFKVGKEFQKYLKIKKYTKKLQRKWRYVLWRRYMVKLRQATIKLQAWWRSQYYKKKYLKKMENIKTINSLWRGGMARRKVAKLRHVKEIIASIIHKGAMKVLEGIHGHAVRKIQPHIRGYLSKCRYSKEIAQIRKTKADFIYDKKIRVVQRNLRGFFVRSTLARLNRSASFIQGHMRMRWHSAYFQILRVSTLRIQKSVRSWLILRKVIRERMDQFMEAEGHLLEDFKEMEYQNFFGSLTPSPSPTKSMKSNGDKSPNSKLKQRNQPDQEEETERDRTPTRSPMTPTPVTFDESPKKSKTFNFNREIDEYTLQKIHLFARVLDFEPISNLDDVYNNSWSMQTLQIQKECMRSGSELQVMEVGQAHTISVSNNKVYSYGWNDSFQLGRFEAPNQLSSTYNQIDFSIDLKVKSVSTGDDHTLMTDSKANLYVWGDNSQGQLGVGNTLTTSGIKMLSFVKDDQIKEINAKGKQSLVITEKGKAYSWPSQIESQDIFVPCELSFPPKIEIATASCGYNFTVLLSKNGMVFTFGQDNQAGQLGHGDTLPREQPTLIEGLKFEDKITAVSCGYKHVICKSSLGKAYTWGWGSKGQLGNGSFEDQLSPKLLAFSNPDMLGKVLQVQAGFKHSVLLLENKKVFWCGSNASIDNECLPIEVNLNQKVQSMNINFIPVRILCSWSKTTNLTYITLADARTIDAVTSTKHKITATLTAGFEDNQTFKDVYPPNIPSIAKYFSLKMMNPLSSPEKKLAKNSQNSPTVAKSPLTKKPSQNADSPPKIVFSQAGGFQEEESPRSPNKSPLSKSIKSPRPTDSTPTPRKEKLKSRKSVASPTAQLSPTKSAKPHRQTVYTSKPAENYVTGQGMPLLLTSQLSHNHPCQTQCFSRSEQKTTLSPRRRESPVMKSPRRTESPVMKSPRRTDSTSTLDNKILKEMVEEGHAQPLYDTLVVIKKRMQAISVIPLNEWTKSDKKFWKHATKPAMFKLLQDIRLD